MSDPTNDAQNADAVPPPDAPMVPPPVRPKAPNPPEKIPATAAPDALTRMPGAGAGQTAAGVMPGGEPLNTLAENAIPGEAGIDNAGDTDADDDTHDRTHGAELGDADRDIDGADANATGYAERRGPFSGDPHES